MKLTLVVLAIVALLLPLDARAAPAAETLRIEDIVARVPVTGNAPANFQWARDGSRYAYSLPGPSEKSPPEFYVHDMRSGRDRKVFGARASVRGSRAREITQIAWSPNAERLAFVRSGDLAVANADGSGLRVVAHDVDDPQWSPDGTRLAYVHARDLYVADVAGSHATRLTHSTSPAVTNGDPDWLYSEELDVAHAYAWSPDGTEIAYLAFDESHVTDFPIQQFLQTPDNAVEHQRYPLAGEANPRVSLHIARADGGGTRTLYDGAPHDEYLVSFVWTPDGTAVVDEILDRAQRRLRLEAFARASGSHRTILRESDARFVDVSPPPKFIDGGKAFLWISERDGVSALYRVATATGVAHKLSGTIPIGAIEQVDERANRAYAHARYPTRREHALVAFALDGCAAPRNLTPERGSHAIVMPERGASAIDTYSRFSEPPVVVRRDLRSGASVTVFATPSLAKYALGTSSLFTIDSPYGKLDAAMIVPPDFDPTRRYPVVVNVYGGPLPVSSGVVADDRWPGLFAHVLAERGIVSFFVNGPATRVDRVDNVRSFSGRMGEVAIRGPLAAATWLGAQPFVDPKRLGLYGWSYGGYLTAFTLTHAPAVYASGISGAPPVDWRFYDSAYTERYLGSPKTERAAYDRTAVLPAAARLRAKLLILQGSSDDNVHLANSLSLLAAFVRAGKQVDYFAFPGARHGPRGTANLRYLDTKMLEWWQRTL